MNLGKGLRMRSKKVLLIDMDPQSNLSYWVDSLNAEVNVETLLERPIALSELQHFEDMAVLPGAMNDASLEYQLLFNDQHSAFKTHIQLLSEHFDYVFIDCPPTKSELSITALFASDAVLIPVITDVLSLQGLNQILATCKQVKERLNPNLEVIGVLPVMVDERRTLTREVLQILSDQYPLHVFNNYIRNNVKAAEAPSFGQSIYAYSPKAKSAIDYVNMSNEFIAVTSHRSLEPVH